MGYNNSFGELHETATKIYTLKLPPVYKETKLYIKCYLFRFLSSIYKVVQVYNVHNTQPEPATSCFLDSCLCCTIVPSTSFSCQCCCTKVPVTSSYSCYSCYSCYQKQQYILKSLCLSPGPGTLLHVALSPILRAVAGCQKTRLCLLLLLHHFFYIRLCWI